MSLDALITASIAQTVQTQNLFDLTLSGNTAGVLALASSGTVTLAGGNNITLSQAGNAITISAFTQTVQTQNLLDVTISGNTSGTSVLVSSGTLTLAGGNNITLSQVGNAITISAFTQTVQTQNLIDVTLSGNTSGTSVLVSSGTLTLAGGNNITLSQVGNAITISGGQSTVLYSHNPIQLQGANTSVLSANTNTSGAATFLPYQFPVAVNARHVNVMVSMTFSTGGASSFRQSHTMSWGLYSRGTGANSTILSAYTSNSLSFALTYNNSSITISQATTTGDAGYTYDTVGSAGLNVSSQYTGIKLMQLLLLTTVPADIWWVGIMDRASSSSFNSGIFYSYIGNNMTLTNLAPMGSLSSAFTSGTGLSANYAQWILNAGSFTSANQTNLPVSVALSAMSGGLVCEPYVSFASTR